MLYETSENGILKKKGKPVLVQIGNDFYLLQRSMSLKGKTDEERLKDLTELMKEKNFEFAVLKEESK